MLRKLKTGITLLYLIMQLAQVAVAFDIKSIIWPEIKLQFLLGFKHIGILCENPNMTLGLGGKEFDACGIEKYKEFVSALINRPKNSSVNPAVLLDVMKRSGNINFLELKPQEILIVSKIIVEPLCRLFLGLIDCIKPELIQLRRRLCTTPSNAISHQKTTDFVELILNSMCYDNGKFIVEFLSTGGERCFKHGNFQNEQCSKFQNKVKYLQNYTDDDDRNDSEICSIFDNGLNCVKSVLDECQNQRPREIFQKIMNQKGLKHWPSSSCLETMISKGIVLKNNQIAITFTLFLLILTFFQSSAT